MARSSCETDLFNQGSVPRSAPASRSAAWAAIAQIKAMRQVAGKLRLDLAQYRELAAFAQFASDLDKATRDQLTRGEKLSEILKQPQFAPLAVEKQVAIIWAATNGYLDDVDTAKIRDFETGLYRYLESTDADLLPSIAKEKAISEALTGRLTKAVLEYRRQGGLGDDEEGAATTEGPSPAAPTAEATAEAAAPADDAQPKAAAAKSKAATAKSKAAARKPAAGSAAGKGRGGRKKGTVA